MFSWLVCRQRYAKTAHQISTKLGWRMSLGPEQTSLTFGADPDEGMDSDLRLQDVRECFSTFSLISLGI